MNKKLIFWVASAVVAIVAMSAVVVMRFSEKQEFVPPPFDENAEKGFPSVSEEYAFADGNIGEHEFYICSKILSENGKAKVFFTNCEENSVWAKIRIIGESGKIIGESGLLNPGEYVEYISLKENLYKGSTVKVKVMLYEPDTYQSEGTIFLEAEIL